MPLDQSAGNTERNRRGRTGMSFANHSGQVAESATLQRPLHAIGECAMKMTTLKDLLIHELKDLHSAEKQIIKALPKLIKAATNDDLKQALENHFHETEDQVARLDEIFGQL